MVELIFDAALRASSTVTTLATGGIYPVRLPTDATFPAIHYLFVGGSSKATQDSYGNQRYRVEVNSWGNSYQDAVTLRHAVIAALSQYSANGIFISFVSLTDFDDHELLEFRAMAEFYIYDNFNPTS
jgi:Protein of unknown function (DUF3168)